MSSNRIAILCIIQALQEAADDTVGPTQTALRTNNSAVAIFSITQNNREDWEESVSGCEIRRVGSLSMHCVQSFVILSHEKQSFESYIPFSWISFLQLERKLRELLQGSRILCRLSSKLQHCSCTVEVFSQDESSVLSLQIESVSG